MRIIIWNESSFEITGEDVSNVHLLDILKTLINGMKKQSWKQKSNGAVIIDITKDTCDVTTGSLSKSQTINGMINVEKSIYKKFVVEAEKVVGKDPKKVEQYLENLLRQGRSNSSKLN